jgi:hypothetical protein
MPQAYRSAVIAAPVDDVWAVVRRFHDLSEWHPVIETSSSDSGGHAEVGAVRRLTTGDGAVIVERLLTLDDEFRRLTYTFVESPFPATAYVSTMHLAPVTDTDQTFIEWYGNWDCDTAAVEATENLFGDGVYGAGLAALRDHVTA